MTDSAARKIIIDGIGRVIGITFNAGNTSSLAELEITHKGSLATESVNGRIGIRLIGIEGHNAPAIGENQCISAFNPAFDILRVAEIGILEITAERCDSTEITLTCPSR